MFFYKTEKTCFYVFYLQINVFIIYALDEELMPLRPLTTFTDWLPSSVKITHNRKTCWFVLIYSDFPGISWPIHSAKLSDWSKATQKTQLSIKRTESTAHMRNFFIKTFS